MSHQTLLQAANEVGKNLRRSSGSTYTTLTQNADVIFIVQMINQAKRLVEARWKWDQLRLTVTFDSVPGQTIYDTSSVAALTSATATTPRAYVLQDRRGLLQFWDVTDNQFRIHRVSRDRAEHQNIVSPVQISKPTLAAWYPNGDGIQIQFLNTPGEVRNYRFECQNPQIELTSPTDLIQVPEEPVILAATALAVQERGEELGMESSTWWDLYEDALGEIMGVDMNDHDLTLVDDRTDYLSATPGGNFHQDGFIG